MSELTQLGLRRVLNRILDEVNTCREEGFARDGNDGPAQWYGIDRIMAIKHIVEEAISGNELACVAGYGDESAELAKRFDKDIELMFRGDEDHFGDLYA